MSLKPSLPPAGPAELARREAWRDRREARERSGVGRSPVGEFPFREDIVSRALGFAYAGVRRAGLSRPLDRTVLKVAVRRRRLAFPDLPARFDGFRLLQVSDVHPGGPVDILAPLAAAVAGIQCDLVVLTGDYRFGFAGTGADLPRPIVAALAGVASTHGTVAILGNHDSHAMVAPFEAAGVRMLVNETVTLEQGGDALHVTGLDDVHAFYDEAADATLAGLAPGFHVGLVHSPELAAACAGAGVRLHLSGHTHGGQICLPGRRPVASHLKCHRDLTHDVWQVGPMHGLTSRGVGYSALPLRLFCPPEAELIELVRAAG